MSGNLFYLHRLSNIQSMVYHTCVWLWNVVLKYYKFIYYTNKKYRSVVACLLSSVERLFELLIFSSHPSVQFHQCFLENVTIFQGISSFSGAGKYISQQFYGTFVFFRFMLLILLLHCISEGNIVFSSLLHLLFIFKFTLTLNHWFLTYCSTFSFTWYIVHLLIILMFNAGLKLVVKYLYTVVFVQQELNTSSPAGVQ